MEYITFKQFIYTISIRNCYTNHLGKDVEDNKVIRIYYSKDGDYKKDHYIDVGWYDYFNKDSVWDILEENLNVNILNSKVTYFYFDEDFNCLVVYLQKKVYETLQEYQN